MRAKQKIYSLFLPDEGNFAIFDGKIKKKSKFSSGFLSFISPRLGL